MELTKKRGRKSKKPNQAEFEFKYYICDMPAEELAKEYRVKPQTIYNWAMDFKRNNSG